MLDYSLPIAFALLFAIPATASVCAFLAISWGLRRRVYNLECDIADLQDRLLSEIKKRAGRETGKSKKEDDDLLASLVAKPQQPKFDAWWLPYADRAGRGHTDQ